MRRWYRSWIGQRRLRTFQVVVGETDLLVRAREDLSREALEAAFEARSQLLAYLRRHPEFGLSLRPLPVDPLAPWVVRQMAWGAARAGVGPMAAVAGAIAEFVGRRLAERSPEVMVENGGDCFLQLEAEAVVGIYAGRSRWSHRVGLRLPPGRWGVCTSSGTVGHSLSLGRADAACVLADTAALADAAATAVGNLVRDGLDEALRCASRIPGVRGVVVIQGSRLGSWGQVELVELG